MSKKHPAPDITIHDPAEDVKHYPRELRRLQIELGKLQRYVIDRGAKILLIFEGRDSAGKDGTIKRITEHLSPRNIRVVALGKPSNREESEWYFQRYVPHLPAAGEIVIFNRSWYNRAGVEKVMGFCTDAQYEEFMNSIGPFQAMLHQAGIITIKYYLDITKHEQKKRLKARATDPLKQWKISPIDEKAQKYWDEYSAARNAMLSRTHSAETPWVVVRANDKKIARLNILRDLVLRLDHRDASLPKDFPDPMILRSFEPLCITDGFLAP
ncbi:MAG: polyphosphate kinase 2 [Rhodospirillales bacterium 20-60-12]|nr:MAG: polyphosphate kinase 2 [Rhodospirillales bacterium 20-60-12]